MHQGIAVAGMVLAGLLLGAGVAGAGERFVDNGDGTVLDAKTGFVWMKNANCWGERSWEEGLGLLSALNRGERECPGYTGEAKTWRLPTREELTSLTVAEPRPEALDAVEPDHPFAGVVGTHYWTVDVDAATPDNAWYVNLHNGHVDSVGKQARYYLWPVRGGKLGR